jgi:hypothetical protein
VLPTPPLHKYLNVVHNYNADTMRNLITIFIVNLLIFSCGQKSEQQEPIVTSDSAIIDTVAVLNSLKSNLNIQTNSFNEIDSSGVVMFPLSMGETSRDGGSLSYKEVPSNSYWNVIFYNSNTGDYHLLSERKMLIRNFDYKYSREDYIDIAQTSGYIFYRVTVEDFNKDRKLTTEDPEYLFISDKEGRNFKQISPDNYNLKSWQLIKSANKVLMTLTKDNDVNKKFDEKDEVVTFEINIDKDTTAKEIFPTQFKNKLKLLYDRDWKRIKE